MSSSIRCYFAQLSRVAPLSAIILATCTYSSAQSVALSLSSGSGTPGQPVPLNIALNSTGDLPDSTQFTLNYSTNDFASASLAPAAGSGKNLSCTDGPGTATCLVWGLNASPITNGNVASATLTLVGSTSDLSSSVQLMNAVSADSTGVAIPTTTSGGTVTIFQQPVLTDLSCNPTSMTPSSGSTCTISLSSAASSQGAIVAISASPSSANVPASVTVPPGSSSTSFSVTAANVSSSTPVTLTASYFGANKTLGITVNPASPPQVTSLSPSSGTGLTQTFTLVYSDPNGLSDLGYAAVLFNTSAKATNTCAVVYSLAANKLYIFNDAGTGYSNGVIPGSSSQASNSQCTLAGAGSSFGTSGNSLTLKVALNFSATFTGHKQVLLKAVGNTTDSGWVQKGSWTP